jgi:hypothetical protein
MKWAVQGIAIEPPVHLPWVASHAAVPHAEPLENGLARVYFTARDERRRSHIAVADVDLTDPGRGIAVAPEPLLAPGHVGAFDDSGVMTSCLVRHGGREYLYYQGWTLGVTVPFYVFVGCAVRDDPEEPFRRVSPAPVMGRHRVDPYMCSSPWVLVEDGLWRMWYVSNLGWTFTEGHAQYRVHIRYAESATGIEWNRDGHVCIDFEAPGEYAISRPVVVKENGLYRMWYCSRGVSYRIGYAESADGLAWTRMDDTVGIEPSGDPWDSEMQAYPFVFDHGGQRHMLYNGNGFGATGIGHAVLEVAETSIATSP